MFLYLNPELYLRPEGDYRPDTIVKQEIYERDIKPNYDVLFALDDRDSVVEMWRSIGLVCLHCDKWSEKDEAKANAYLGKGVK